MPNTVPPNPTMEMGDDEDDATVDVDFDTWAMVSAQLLRRSVAERAKIIYDSGFDASWQRIDGHWYAVLAADIADGKLDRVDRYHAICRQHLEQRAAEFGPVATPLDPLHDPAPLSQTPPFARAVDSERAK